MKATVVRTYELRVLAHPLAQATDERRVRANLPSMMMAVEEDLTDLLPEGWAAQIAMKEER